MARLGGNVHITRGQNQLNGAEADVNMKTGIATLVAQKAAVGQKPGRVHGLVVPNDESNKSLGASSTATPGGGTSKAPVGNAASPTTSGQQP